MALDPEAVGTFIFTVISSVGAAMGGAKVIDKRKQANTPEQSALCAEHHKCFEEIKTLIGTVKEDISYIKGRIDER